MNEPPARIGAPIDEIDTPALVARPRRLRAEPRNAWRLLPGRPGCASGRTPRRTSARRSRSCRSPRARWDSVARRSARPRRWCVAACAMCWSATRSSTRGSCAGWPRWRRTRPSPCVSTRPKQVDAASRAAREAGVELGGLVEIEVGMQRCGIAPGQPAADLARRIAHAPGLRFRGLQAYHGAAQHLPALAERERAIAGAANAVRTTIDALQASGLACELVSGAGTGTYRIEGSSGVWNELQAGSYLFMDTDYARIGDNRRRTLQRLRAQPVRARDGDERARSGPRDRRRRAEIVQRGEGSALGPRPGRHSR